MRALFFIGLLLSCRFFFAIIFAAVDVDAAAATPYADGYDTPCHAVTCYIRYAAIIARHAAFAYATPFSCRLRAVCRYHRRLLMPR